MESDEQSMLDSAIDKAPGFEGRAAGSLGNPTPTASSPAHSLQEVTPGVFTIQESQAKDTAGWYGTSLYASYSPVLDAPETNVLPRTKVFSGKPTQGGGWDKIEPHKRIVPRPDEIGYT